MALKGNKGDWSEIYTFFHVLINGKLDVVDENLNVVPGEYYKILEVIRKENKTEKRYIREDDKIRILITDDLTGKVTDFAIPISDFVCNSNKLFSYLRKNNGRSFSLPDIEDFLASLKIHSVKDNGNKRDITIKIEDFHCGMKQTLGFSIKSLIGQDATLFNAGAGTNFIYEIKLGDNVDFDVDKFNKETYINNKIAQRILRLKEEFGAKIEFCGVQSNTLYQNLRLIDGDIPNILAEILLVRYIYGLNKVKECVAKLQETNPLDFNLKLGQPFYEYKIKKFLQDVAMGMTPETAWTGIYDATGGQIIVKDSGDIVCYHIYEQNLFLNFLLSSTYFEQPATSEDKNYPGHIEPNPKKKFFFGWVYKENGRFYIKLNLQIRMKEKKLTKKKQTSQ